MHEASSTLTDDLVAIVDKIVFENLETGFTVAKVKERQKSDLTTAVGNLTGITVGQTLMAKGIWRHRPQYGWSFEVKEYALNQPHDKKTILLYLQSGAIHGIGPSYAQRIVDTFGDKTLSIIAHDPQKLRSVAGIGEKRLESILSSWRKQEHLRDLLLFLQPFEVSNHLVQKIYRYYQTQAIEKIKADPYCLARDLHGVGFKRADQIAQKMGFGLDHPERLKASIEHILEEANQDGHTCLPLEKVVERAQVLCEQASGLVEHALKELEVKERVHIEEITLNGSRHLMVWIKPYFVAERGIAAELHRLINHPSQLRKVEALKAVNWVQSKLSIQLAQNQQKAVELALKSKVMILTGGPGTGKSTITKAIVQILLKLTSKILLAAPTGRAAKRLSEINQKEASTLHQLLEYDFKNGGFKRNRQNPLSTDLIIVDEASMLDTFLFYSLLKALPDHAKLLIVGDIDQLPSVGAGNVLRDIMQSRRIPVQKLDEIYRQAQASSIILSAHEINRGIAPIRTPTDNDDFYFLKLESPERILATILSLVCERLPKKYGFDPIKDIQVLAPMKKGMLGIENLNHQLQELLHSRAQPTTVGYRRFYEGDKLMQLKNNYQKEVFNGDLLYLQSIDVQSRLLQAMTVDERIIEYEFNELDELAHAYAVSVHKYQGSECPCIIMPIHSSHTMMLERNLVYTGVTRGKKLVVLIGSPAALQRACIMQNAKDRYTGLTMSLIEKFGSWGGLFEQKPIF
jgi:exodeoxyribonuclease V alpha subunit